MDRTERFYKIERLIRSRRPGEPLVSFVEMMDELGVSRATLKRDLEYLRSRLDAPIVYDRYGNGYRFESGPLDRAGHAQHELPGVWFSERELHALLSMHHLIRDLDEGGVLGRHLQPLLDKLQGLLGDEAEARELMKRIRIASPARRPVPARHFELLGSALVQRRRVHLAYYTRSRRQRSLRNVSPQRLVHWRNTWYLDAWCHDSDGLRRFALDAVEEATLLDQKAKEVSLKTVQEQLDAGYGVFSGATLHWAELVFSSEAAQWVAQEQWHAAQEGERLPDGRFRLRLPYAEPTELLMDVLRHGAEVEVVSPASLRRQVRERLRAAVSLYEG
jgi:predicted DNA-binding transcriptional regulator YafY